MVRPLSVILITKNSAATLGECLSSVRGLAGEIVVVDDGSTDDTLKIAGKFGARVHRRALESFSAQKQFALDQAAGPWVFLIDSDEAVPPELAGEIEAALALPRPPAACRLPRKNYYFGKWLRHGGKYPDYQVRLFQKKNVRFGGEIVHETVRVEGEIRTLRNALDHFSYPDVSVWLAKLELFSRMRAAEWERRGLRPSLWNALRFCLIRPKLRFLRRFFFKLGFLDGLPGLLACLHDALTDILAYASLRRSASSD